MLVVTDKQGFGANQVIYARSYTRIITADIFDAVITELFSNPVESGAYRLFVNPGIVIGSTRTWDPDNGHIAAALLCDALPGNSTLEIIMGHEARLQAKGGEGGKGETPMYSALQMGGGGGGQGENGGQPGNIPGTAGDRDNPGLGGIYSYSIDPWPSDSTPGSYGGNAIRLEMNVTLTVTVAGHTCRIWGGGGGGGGGDYPGPTYGGNGGREGEDGGDSYRDGGAAGAAVDGQGATYTLAEAGDGTVDKQGGTV